MSDQPSPEYWHQRMAQRTCAEDEAIRLLRKDAVTKLRAEGMSEDGANMALSFWGAVLDPRYRIHQDMTPAQREIVRLYVDAVYKPTSPRTFPRVTLGSVAPGSLIENAGGFIALALAQEGRKHRRLLWVDTGLIGDMHEGATVSLRATPAELDALTSADAPLPPSPSDRQKRIERLTWLADHGGTTEQISARAELMRLRLRRRPLGAKLLAVVETAFRAFNGVLFTRGIPTPAEIAENEAKHGDLTSDDAKPLTCAWLAVHDAPAKRCPKVAVVELFTTEEDAEGEAGTWMMVPGFTPAFSRPDHLGKWAEEAWWTPLSWMRLPVRLASEDDLRAWREDAIARRFPDDLNVSPGSLRLKVYGLLADYAEHMKRPRA